MTNKSLSELREKFPTAAIELGLLSGRIDPETGKERENFEQDEIQDWIEECVLEVLDLICEQGHSGFSHSYFISCLVPLLKGKPITPLTGKDWEWGSAGPDQNKRCGSVFKRPDGSAYFIDGYAFSDNGGKTYYTSRESFKTITFPCSNKELETAYIIIDKPKEISNEN